MASLDLLISQWENADNLRGTIQAFLDEAEDQIATPLRELVRMNEIDEAEGVWLDRLGARLGIDRPYTSIGAEDPRWGFEGVDDARGFDEAPFAGAAVNEAVYPLPDVVFRRFIRARGVAVLGDGTFQNLIDGARHIDETASLVDNLDMSVLIVTNYQWQFELADTIGALPRTAGVRIGYRDRLRFGYDAAGQPFDQGHFTGA